MGTRDTGSRAIDDLRQYGGSLVDSVPGGRVDSVALRTIARRGRHRRSPRIAMVLVTVGLLLVSNVGLASVSDRAAPGDFLYPLDRGYEWASDRFGASDRTLERLTESMVLTERGDTDEAIELLTSELATPSSDNDLIAAAIEELEAKVQRGNDGADGNQDGQGNRGGNPVPSTPAATAPGQVDDEGFGPDPDSPSATAPGRIKDDEGGDNPGNDLPGQTKDNEAKDDGDAIPPGQDKPDPPASSAVNGNNGNGNNAP